MSQYSDHSQPISPLGEPAEVEENSRELDLDQEQAALPHSIYFSTTVNNADEQPPEEETKSDEENQEKMNDRFLSLLNRVEAGEQLKELELRGLEEEETFFRLVRDQRTKVKTYG